MAAIGLTKIKKRRMKLEYCAVENLRLEVRVVFVVVANYSLDRMRFLPPESLVEKVFSGPTQSNSMVSASPIQIIQIEFSN